MRFTDIKFGYTSGGPNLIGGYMLQILRPDRFGTFELFTLGCGNCYEDLSFLTWCMDKNRPLPPGKPFDPFREKDFQRRKREKFPPPPCTRPTFLHRKPHPRNKKSAKSFGGGNVSFYFAISRSRPKPSTTETIAFTLKFSISLFC